MSDKIMIMRIFSWNVNGIRAVHKKGLFLPLIEKHQPDIICLQETKAEQEQSPIDLPEYDEYWSSAERKGYSGTAIFTKLPPIAVYTELPATIAKQFNLEDKYGSTINEGRITTLEFEEFFVTSVYTPNAKDDLSRLPVRQEWDKAFLAYMKHLKSIKPVIFCGDLNVAHTELDLARPKENKGKKGFTNEERLGVDNMIKAGFVDSFRVLNNSGENYTWWSHFANARERNVGWRIDYIMMDGTLLPLLKKASIHPDLYGSDHCPVSMEISL